MTLPSHPMQLLSSYHAQLDARFLSWYEKTFTSDRRHYGHITACEWTVNFADDYQEVVEDAGAQQRGWHTEIQPHTSGAAVVQNAPATTDLYAHTFHRNTNSWATCIACCQGATAEDLGQEPPTPDQIDAFITIMVRDHVDQHVPVANFMSHGEAAGLRDFPKAMAQQCTGVSDAEAQALGAPHANYGPSFWTDGWPQGTCERWDLEYWVDPRTRIVYPPSGPCTVGCLRLPNYLRGEAILGIQAATKAKWAA